MQRLIKRLFPWLGLSLLGGLLPLAGLNVWVVQRSHGRITTDPAAVPAAPVALVLGTSRTVGSGRINLHWKMRMDAAAALWKARRVSRFLVSGDRRRKANYNEPRDMRDGLVERGVPISAITLDYSGFRTLDSVIRAQEIFGVNRCVIVSDDFHLPRAIWLADRRGMQVTGFHGPAVPWELSGKTRVREWLARINAALDEWVLGTTAAHYGPREEMPGVDSEPGQSPEPGRRAASVQ